LLLIRRILDLSLVGRDGTLKNKIYDSFDAAIADISDGAVIADSSFGTQCLAMNLWAALTRKEVKRLTIVTLMAHCRQPTHGVATLPAPMIIDCILQPGKIERIYTGFNSNVSAAAMEFAEEYRQATRNTEIIPVPYGNLCTRLEAAANGYGGILTPVGVGTYLEELCESVVLDGKRYLLEKPLQPDFAFVKAWKADKLGNLVYRRMQRVLNPVIARAAKTTIAEVLEIVEPGELDPDFIHTPHVYVDRIVKIPKGGTGSLEWMQVVKKQNFGPGGRMAARMALGSAPSKFQGLNGKRQQPG
jgi:3-oxoacid CoA-transferase subunit A